MSLFIFLMLYLAITFVCLVDNMGKVCEIMRTNKAHAEKNTHIPPLLNPTPIVSKENERVTLDRDNTLNVEIYLT